MGEQILLRRKGKKSFSQVIKENLCPNEEKLGIMSLAGISKDDKQALKRLKHQIDAEREANYARTFE